MSAAKGRRSQGRAIKDVVKVGTPPIEVVIRVSARARRYSLRISQRDGQARLTVPKYSSRAQAVAFARGQEAWLRQHLAKRQQPLVPQVGMMVPYEGQMLELKQGSGRRTSHKVGALHLSGPPETHAKKLASFLKLAARDRLVPLSEAFAKQLGQKINRFSFRDTRSRWGSCSAEGNLMYSWRLVMAPPEILEYLAAHEVSHLVEMNHSPAYWKIVGAICPDFQARRKWLRQNGAALQRYQF